MGAESDCGLPVVGRLASAHRQLRNRGVWRGNLGELPRSQCLGSTSQPPRARSLPGYGCVLLDCYCPCEDWGRAPIFLPFARADRQTQPLRIAYYSPCFEHRADLTVALLPCPSVLLCSAFQNRSLLVSLVVTAVQVPTRNTLPALSVRTMAARVQSSSRAMGALRPRVRKSTPCLLCCSRLCLDTV